MSDDESWESTRPEELTGIVGKHFIYTYENGWQYELYVKNEKTIDYRIHNGMVAGRWVQNQASHIVKLAEGIFKISWDEPTGTSVSLSMNFPERKTHGNAFFPRWVKQFPERTICHQNEYIDLMLKYRDEGPTYPKFVIDEFSKITFLEQLKPNDDTVISVAPSELPKGYASRVK